MNLIGSHDLCIFRLLRWSQTWSSPTGGSGSSSSQSLRLPFLIGVACHWRQAQKSLRTPASSLSRVARSPVFSQIGPTLSLVFLLLATYVQKPFQLSLVSCTRGFALLSTEYNHTFNLQSIAIWLSNHITTDKFHHPNPQIQHLCEDSLCSPLCLLSTLDFFRVKLYQSHLTGK